MKPIDFDARFTEYADRWIQGNREKYANMGAMEAAMPEVYMRWLNAPADWLGGVSPAECFARMDDPEALAELLREYRRTNTPIPDLLLERLSDLGAASLDALCALARESDDELRVIAINLMAEIGDAAPMNLCLDLIDDERSPKEAVDAAAELLTGLGEAVVEPVLGRVSGARPEAFDAYLDILCNFPGDERIYSIVENAFTRGTGQKALYASYLAKLGDERAIEPLTRALPLSELNYLDYIEIVQAIEALGGEVKDTREFSGDPYYESLKSLT